LCDNFEKLVVRLKREYYVFKLKNAEPNQNIWRNTANTHFTENIQLTEHKNNEEKSFLMDSIRRTMKMVCGEKNLDRRHFVYTKKGHKKIGLKSREKFILS
jgi:hypothetical protein